MNTKKFIQKAKEIHGNKYDYSKSIYTKYKEKLTITCKKHGPFQQSPNAHLTCKNGCFKCHIDKIKKQNSSTTQQFIQKANKKHNNKYDYSKVKYQNNLTKVTIICPYHGEFEQTPQGHLRNNGCKKCKYDLLSKKFSDNKSKFIHKAIQIHGNKYYYHEVEYTNSNTKVKLICKKHGAFKQRPARHLVGNGCPKCHYNNASTRLSLGIKNYIQRAYQVHQNKYQYSITKYAKLKDDITITCPYHGNFTQNAGVHLKGSGCQKCNISSCHSFICNYLSDSNINYEINNRVIIHPKELDIIIPNHDLAIEINGIYWHSYNHLESKQDKTKHLEKTKRCEKLNIRLIHLLDYDITNKQEIILSILNNKLKLINNQIPIEQCAVRPLSPKESKKFLNDNHIQGYIGSTAKYGLFYKNKLVQYIGLTKKQNMWELNRLATQLNTTIAGGANKLFKEFLNNHKPKLIICYVDRRYHSSTDNNIYKNLGFKYATNTSPNYQYVKGSNLYTRKQYQKHKLKHRLNNFDTNLSEAQNMFNNGYRRLWDCGNIKLIWCTN